MQENSKGEWLTIDISKAGRKEVHVAIEGVVRARLLSKCRRLHSASVQKVVDTIWSRLLK